MIDDELCRRGLIVNADKCKVMVMNGEERLEREVHEDGVHLEHVSEFKYFGCVLFESGTDGENLVGRWKVGGRWQVQLGPQLMLGICRLNMLVLHKALFVLVLTYDSKTMIRKEKGKSRIRAV